MRPCHAILSTVWPLVVVLLGGGVAVALRACDVAASFSTVAPFSGVKGGSANGAGLKKCARFLQLLSMLRFADTFALATFWASFRLLSYLWYHASRFAFKRPRRPMQGPEGVALYQYVLIYTRFWHFAKKSRRGVIFGRFLAVFM